MQLLSEREAWIVAIAVEFVVADVAKFVEVPVKEIFLRRFLFLSTFRIYLNSFLNNYN